MSQAARSSVCPNCGYSGNPTAASTCGMCGYPLGWSDASGPAEKSKFPPIATGLGVAALIIVTGGLLLGAPGLGVLVLIATVPFLIRALSGARAAAGTKAERSTGRNILLGITSTVFVLLMLALSAFVGFWVFCLSCMGIASLTGPGPGEVLAYLGAGIATLAAVGGLVYGTYRVVTLIWPSPLDK